jgi:hypothetical protein
MGGGTYAVQAESKKTGIFEVFLQLCLAIVAQKNNTYFW